MLKELSIQPDRPLAFADDISCFSTFLFFALYLFRLLIKQSLLFLLSIAVKHAPHTVVHTHARAVQNYQDQNYYSITIRARFKYRRVPSVTALVMNYLHDKKLVFGFVVVVVFVLNPTRQSLMRM